MDAEAVLDELDAPECAEVGENGAEGAEGATDLHEQSSPADDCWRAIHEVARAHGFQLAASGEAVGLRIEGGGLNVHVDARPILVPIRQMGRRR